MEEVLHRLGLRLAPQRGVDPSVLQPRRQRLLPTPRPRPRPRHRHRQRSGLRENCGRGRCSVLRCCMSVSQDHRGV
eukprot:1384476-Rhodomonas_salina.2